MTIQINPDLVVQQELAARGVDSSVGVFGSHYVQIGKASPIRLDEIKSAAVPSAGFWKATQIQNGKDGVRLTAAEAVGVLLRPGALDAERLLGLLKACQTHMGRLAALGQLTQAQKDDGTWVFTQAVRNLSNADLAAAYQVFASAEMDLLQTALQREGEINPAARDARKAAEQLFDLQALVLRESANRAAAARLDDLRQAAPKDPALSPEAARLPRAATEQYGSAGGLQVDVHGNDLSAQALGVLVETAASSAAERERSADPALASLRRRSFDGVTVKQIGDVMRSKELTVNMKLDTFLERSAILDHPDRPIDTMWTLKERQIETRSTGYEQKREATELAHFPELKHAQAKGATRPVYGAVNFQESLYGAAGDIYGHVTIVLKPEVARRATYTVNDSFRTVALTVDRQRRENFFALFGGAAGIPDELKLAVADRESPERRALEEWFDKIEQACRERGSVTAEEYGVESYFPQAIKDRCDSDRGDDQAVMALVFKCFGNPAATRTATATHDNLESLLPHLSQVNSAALAQAARDRAQGGDTKLYLVGTAYLEAQIHGPVVPERDIAEIRVNLTCDNQVAPLTPTQREAARTRLEDFARRTGVRIVYTDADPIEEGMKVGDLSEKAKTINAAHHDHAAIDQRRDEYLADFPATVARMLKEIHLPPIPAGMDLVLRGKVLDRILEAFLRRLEETRRFDSWTSESVLMVENALDFVLRPIADEKLGLLQEAAKLEYTNADQKRAFVDWLLQSGERIDKTLVPGIHRQATAQAALFRTWAAAEPPPAAEAALAAFAALPATQGTDPRHASGAAIALLFSDVPPPTPDAMKKILGILDSDLLRGMTSQIQAAATAEPLNTAADAGRAAALAVGIRTAAGAIAGAINAAAKAPTPCLLPLSAIPAPVRAAIRQVAPALADALDAAHPAHPAFPAPANPGALPQNKAQRKQFLLSQMEAYRDKELVSERGLSVHGRGHIIRSYFYATAFCNILKEQGVPVDRNAVILGITGHDLGRGGTGHDKWERQSARKTNQAIRQQYGENTAGEAWENEVTDSIVGVEIQPPGLRKRTVPVSPTMEAQLLQSADSLDIGRTGDFDPYYFDFLRDKNGTVSPEAQKIRDQLADEANLLQRLTSPARANYETLDKLTKAASFATDDKTETHYKNQREALDAHIRNELVAQAENADNEAFFDAYEDIIRRNPQMFPLLTKYYLNGD